MCLVYDKDTCQRGCSANKLHKAWEFAKQRDAEAVIVIWAGGGFVPLMPALL